MGIQYEVAKGNSPFMYAVVRATYLPFVHLGPANRLIMYIIHMEWFVLYLMLVSLM